MSKITMETINKGRGKGVTDHPAKPIRHEASAIGRQSARMFMSTEADYGVWLGGFAEGFIAVVQALELGEDSEKVIAKRLREDDIEGRLLYRACAGLYEGYLKWKRNTESRQVEAPEIYEKMMGFREDAIDWHDKVQASKNKSTGGQYG